MNSTRYIVIIRTSAIGDVVLATACLDYIEKCSANLKVIWIGSEPSLSLFQSHPVIDKSLIVKKGEDLELESIRHYDISGVLDLQVNLRSIALTKKMSRIFNCPSERWNKDSLARGYLVFKARVRGRSISKKNGSFIPKYQTMLFSLQNLFAKMKMNHSNISNAHPKLCLAETDIDNIRELDKKFIWIGISPGASYLAKRLPVDLWDIVIESISNLSVNIGICCFGSVDDKDDAKLLEFHAKKHGVKFNDFTGLLKLDETAKVLAAMNLFIGNDSGLGHIAEALGTSSFIFFGPTVEDFGFVPWRCGSRTFSSDIGCRPCSKHGKSECRYNDYLCFTKINFSKFEQELINFFGVQ